MDQAGFVRPAGRRTKAPIAPIVQRASDLLEKHFPPIRWAIRDILPEGVSLLVGAPKIGKSWLALQFAIAISSGTSLWTGRDPETTGGVLFLGLEDNDRRMQSRIVKLCRQEAFDLSHLHFATEWPRMDQGGCVQLENWLSEQRDTRLVIIDTLGRFRPPDTGRGSAYQADYRVGAELKGIADNYSVAILLAHHTRKQEAADVLDTVSGTQGLTGSVDALMMLRRERGEMDAAFFVTGRDIEHEQDYALQFNSDTCTWSSSGTVHVARMHLQRQRILDFIERNGPSKPCDIAEGLGKKPTTTRRLLQKMFADGEVRVESNRYCLIHTSVNGVNGGNGVFDDSSVHDVHDDDRGEYLRASRGD
jgi:RecA-family ATPase